MKNLEILKNGTNQVLPEDEFEKKLVSGKKLKIKFGADPTAPDLHLGHAVVLEKLRQFQELGHEVIFLIGDFTARIGDPSGKSKTRPSMSTQEIEKNAQTYVSQVSKILDPEKTTITYNSEWLEKINLSEFLKIAGKITLARLIERDDFQNRLQGNVPIGFHELFYPIIQGYDSVALKADIELGGTDQTFNLLMGRFLQEQFGQEPQVIMTMPILEGLDGEKKMSKSLNNYVGLWEAAEQAFGKLMSISDTLMLRYYYLLLGKTKEELRRMRDGMVRGKLHPMKLKKEMAFLIVKKFWSEQDAQLAQENFEALFQKQDYSKAQEVKIPKDLKNPLWVIALLKELGAIQSSSEGQRLISAGAVEIDGKLITVFKAEIHHKPGIIIKVGKKRIYKIK
ncbi:MAG: tyrosine--tRNA ligase [bacterium]